MPFPLFRGHVGRAGSIHPLLQLRHSQHCLVMLIPVSLFLFLNSFLFSFHQSLLLLPCFCELSALSTENQCYPETLGLSCNSHFCPSQWQGILLFNGFFFSFSILKSWEASLIVSARFYCSNVCHFSSHPKFPLWKLFYNKSFLLISIVVIHSK